MILFKIKNDKKEESKLIHTKTRLAATLGSFVIHS